MGPKALDISGHVYGKLTVLEQSGRADSGGAVWRCLCECGTERVTSSNAMRTGKVKACVECAKAQLKTNAGKRPGNAVNIAPGTVFAELTVLREVAATTDQRRFLCQCSCGKETEVDSYPLRKGATKSCGHLIEENRSLSGLQEAFDLSGSTQGFLEYVENADYKVTNGRKIRMIKTLCRACNTEKVMEAGKYIAAEVRSCGCMKTQLRAMSMPKPTGPFLCSQCHETKPKSEWYYSKGKRSSPCKICFKAKVNVKRAGPLDSPSRPAHCVCETEAERQLCQHACEYLAEIGDSNDDV